MSVIRRLLFAIPALSVCLVLTSCGSGIEGAWKLTGGSAVSQIYSLSPSESLESSGSEVVFRFNDDGMLSIDMTRGGELTTSYGSWSESNDVLTITMNGEPVRCSYSADKSFLAIYFKLNGQTVSFNFNKI